jgi:ornithine cyclodeaminase/alanine dehydrogenase-like protein (mu-crystallin family)
MSPASSPAQEESLGQASNRAFNALLRAPATLILTRGDIAALMTVNDYLKRARSVPRLGSGRAQSPMPLYLQAEGGGIHAKGALLRTASGGTYAAVKVNANFPGNPKNAGLPTIQGGIVL